MEKTSTVVINFYSRVFSSLRNSKSEVPFNSILVLSLSKIYVHLQHYKKNLIKNSKHPVNVNNIQDFDSSEKKKPGLSYAVVLIILTILIVVVGIMYVDQRMKTKKVVAELHSVSNEKTKVRNELNDLLIEYDELRTNNDSINLQLESEQEKIKSIIKQLKTVKANNYAQIDKYKKEVNTLRKIMKGFIYQIDSLNTLNIELTAENTQVKRDYRRISDQKTQLEQTNEDLSSKVAKASVIRTFNIKVLALNTKGKTVKKYKKTDKFQVCFTLDENAIVRSGERDVYVRISRPDELVLIESEDNLFTFEGNEIAYTAKRIVNYENKQTEMCLYYDNNEELIPGIYFVDVFVDGNQIGTTNLELK